METFLTIHAHEVFASIAEVEAPHKDRNTGTQSKLKTYRDGFRILMLALYLVKDMRPFTTFSVLAFVFVSAALAIGVPVILEYLEIGLVPKFPRAILATGLMIFGAICLTSGVILNSVARSKREIKRLLYQMGGP